jgi:hypothetical protein
MMAAYDFSDKEIKVEETKSLFSKFIFIKIISNKNQFYIY